MGWERWKPQTRKQILFSVAPPLALLFPTLLWPLLSEAIRSHTGTGNWEEGAQPCTLRPPHRHSETCPSPSPAPMPLPPPTWYPPPKNSIQLSIHRSVRLSIPLFHVQLFARRCTGLQGCPANKTRPRLCGLPAQCWRWTRSNCSTHARPEHGRAREASWR